MPRLRLLAGSSLAASSETAGADARGNLMFGVAAGDTVKINIEATGYVADGSITLSEWEAPDGAILDGAATSGAVVSTLATIPDALAGAAFTVTNTLTLADGQMRNTSILLRVQ